MTNQTEINSYDRSLQKLEFELEWNMERSQIVRNQLSKNIQRSRLKTNVKKTGVYLISIGVSASIFFLLITNQFVGNNSPLGSKANNQPIYTMEVINGKETPVLTEKGMKSIVYPLDAHQHIKTIITEPMISTHLDKRRGKEQLYIYAYYPTSTAGKGISVHYGQNETGSVEQMIESILPTYPVNGLNISEVNVSGQRAVLYEPTTDLIATQLFIVTKKYVYYLSISGTKGERKGEGEELIQLANLFNFELER